MKKNLEIDYDMLLLDFLQNLNDCNCAFGGEGKAYFIDDKFIIKEYCNVGEIKPFDEIFDSYCSEMQKFSKRGLNVPKIYSWLKVPNNIYKTTNKYNNGSNYYILEERVAGRPLFYGFLDDFYDEIKNCFDSKLYFETIHFPENNIVAFKEIMKSYIDDYVKSSELIESLSDAELSKLVTDIYTMYVSGKFSIPDLYASNVLVNGRDIKTIDNNFLTKYNQQGLNFNNKVDLFISGLFSLFIYVASLQDNKDYLMRNSSKNDEIIVDRYIEKSLANNRKTCKAAMAKILTIMNKYLDFPGFTFQYNYDGAIKKSKRIFGEDGTKELFEQIKTKF